MRLDEFVGPGSPFVQKRDSASSVLDSLANFNENLIMKGSDDAREKGRSPEFGVDYIANSYIRNQLAYRRQLISDLQNISYTVEEIRAPIGHIINEVFRQGLSFSATTDKPDSDQLTRMKKVMSHANQFGQTLEEVLRLFEFDVNTIDDAFLYLVKEYVADEKNKVSSKVVEIRRMNPALIEFDLDEMGLPNNTHFICPIHREAITESPGNCKIPSHVEEGSEGEPCGIELRGAMYRFLHRTQVVYFLENEIIHTSKFTPTETYGMSPILTIFEKALTLIGMDKNLYRYFFERKMPASMLMVQTDDPEALKRERAIIQAETRKDPNYVPMIAVSARNQRGRVDMVRLFHTLQEMDYLPIKDEIRERIAAIWGVTPVWQGNPDSFGGMSTQTSQLVVMGRTVESDQRRLKDKVFPRLLEAFGITDFELVLPNPEEKAEATRISFSQQRVNNAKILLDMGYTLKLKNENADMDDIMFVVTGEPVPLAQIEAESQALGVESMHQQVEQQAEQAQQQADQTAQQQQGGEEVPPEMNPMQLEFDPVDSVKIPRFGRVPTAMDKTPLMERDVDEYNEARDKVTIDRIHGLAKSLGSGKTWIQDLMDKGFTPIIKGPSPDGSKLWFASNGTEYVANLTPNGVGFIEKATFSTSSIHKPENRRSTTVSEREKKGPYSYENEDE
jgi:hypothetical protein